MNENLQKIREALSKYAPSVTPIEGCGGDNDGRIIDSFLFVGKRLAFLASEYFDGCVELFCRESDCNEEPCRLLVHEHWSTVARTIILLESNRVPWIQSDEPIKLKDQSRRLDTVIGSESC